MMKIAPFAFAAMLVSHPSHAIFVEGNELYQQCLANDFRWAHCEGFVLGVSDTIEMEQAAGYRNVVICIPQRATRGQIVDVVKLHMQQNPKDRHSPAVTLVVVALREAFPCE